MLGSRIGRLYRQMLLVARALPDEARRQDACERIRSGFRAGRAERDEATYVPGEECKLRPVFMFSHLVRFPQH